MNFLFVEMKGLVLTFYFVFTKSRIFMYLIVWIQHRLRRFFQFYFLERHCYYYKLSQNRMHSRRNNKAFYYLCVYS